jgi:alkylation response protein AidB-like acyl-CoA dehydrogenase
MDLEYSEFEEMVRETVRDFARRESVIARRREAIAQGTTFDATMWRQMAELGWLGLAVDTAYGGAGAKWVDVIVLLEAMGQSSMPSTPLAHILAGMVIQRYGNASQKQALLAAVASGSQVWTVAVTEPRLSLDPDGIRCEAIKTEHGFELRGTKHFVRGANAADGMIILARLEGKLALLVVTRGSNGLRVTALDNISDEDQAKVELDNVAVPPEALLGGTPQDWQVLTEIVEMGSLLECGHGVGLMAGDQEMTISYVKQRMQFGRPIGSFQSVQHDVADQVTDVDCARYLTLYAAWAMDEGLASAGVEVARAKAWVSDALRRVVRTGNQLHGGIGFTLEYDLHLYYRAAKTSELTFGTADEHRERVASALLDG